MKKIAAIIAILFCAGCEGTVTHAQIRSVACGVAVPACHVVQATCGGEE